MSDQVISGNFTFTDTSIEGVKIVDVKAYGDDRGYFMETYKRPDFIAGGGLTVSSYKTINRLRRAACCADCVSRSSTRRRSSCVLFQARFLMLRLICAKVARRMASEREWCFLLRTSASSSFLVGSRTASSFCPILPSSATNAMMSTTPTMKAASCGTTSPSGSSGQRSKAMSSSIRPISS